MSYAYIYKSDVDGSVPLNHQECFDLMHDIAEETFTTTYDIVPDNGADHFNITQNLWYLNLNDPNIDNPGQPSCHNG